MNPRNRRCRRFLDIMDYNLQRRGEIMSRKKVDYTVTKEEQKVALMEKEKKFYSDDVIEELIAFRKKKKMTQQDIAERSGIMRPNVARLEARRTEPTMDVLSRYAKSMGMDIKINLVKKK